MYIAHRSSLCSRLRAVLAGLLVLVLVPGVSLAEGNYKEKDKSKGEDYCITFPGHAVFELVGQGFAIPDPGRCEPWTGFFITSVNSPSTSAGTGCTATDGSDLAITITSSSAQGRSLSIQSLCPFRRRLAQTSKPVSEFLPG